MKIHFRILISYFRLLILSVFVLLSGSTIYAQSGSLRINEFMSLNQFMLTDEDGDYSDWIELYNPTSDPAELLGWTLTDDKNLPRKWVFPDVTIQANSYLVVFASGKDRRIPHEELHTNFKLSGDGEYLALFNPEGKAFSEFDPSFPVQQPDVSFGYFENMYHSMPEATPGKENVLSGSTILSVPVFSKNHGFFDSPFNLEINSTDQGAKIYYTIDGSVPAPTNGKLYESPLTIGSTTILRARSIKDNLASGKIATQTYLFPEDVVHQSNKPEGYPLTWGPYINISGTSIADYEMDPEMMGNPEFLNSVKTGLLDLPTMSITTNKDNFFSKVQDPGTGGIYIYTGPPISDTENGYGFGWERPVSVEYFDAKGSASFQVDCGIQIQGGAGRIPEKSPKHSLRLLFKSEYGPSKLNFPLFGNDASTNINSIVLRAGFGNSWVHHDNKERTRAKYLEDRWAKDTQMAMGNKSSHGIFVHLYINGIYWGIYNPSERMDNDFAAEYLGGYAEDYDVIKDYAAVSDGNITAWNTMMTLVNAGLSNNESYQRLRGNNSDGTPNPQLEAMVDVMSLSDYMLINFYGGNSDWGTNNWVAMRNRVDPGKGFRFFCWDEERTLENNLNVNILNQNDLNSPTHIFQQLRQNAEFRRLFADRVQKFCFNDGALTPKAADERWTIRRSEIEKSVDAESARWGDYRRDVHPYQVVGPFDLYTKDAYWIPQMNYMADTYFPSRTTIFVNQLKAANLFPSVDAPVFQINNNPIITRTISSGDTLIMTANKGTIYYTTDGSDPVIWNTTPVVSPVAIKYSKSIILTGSSHIKARTFYVNAWSATSERFFVLTDNFHDIKITEIHYHPLNQGAVDGQEFEFIELKNTGTSTIDLGGIQFINGIKYEFPSETQLKPKGFVVLASSTKSFYERYGFLPFGEYTGQLDNSGEKLELITSAKDTLCSISYSDTNGWPQSADGSGYSLVPTEYNPVNGQELPEYWRASHQIGGSPGADDVLTTEKVALTKSFTLEQNYPNPFAESTSIPYHLKEEAFVELSVYNLIGQQKIVTLENSRKPAGYHTIDWHGLDQGNHRVENGIYFYRISVTSHNETYTTTNKMLIIR